MKRNLVLFSLVLFVAVLATAVDAVAQGVQFNVSATPRDVRREGTTEAVSGVLFTAASAGTVSVGTTVDVNYGTAVFAPVGGVVPGVTTTCAGAGAVISAAFVAGAPNIVRISFTGAASTCAIGSTITLSGVRVNANTFVGTSIVPTLTPNIPVGGFQVTFIVLPGFAVATIQPQASAVVVTAAGGGILTCVTSATGPFTVRVTENFSSAFTSEADEDLLGGVAIANSVDTVVRIQFAAVPIGVSINLTGITIPPTSASLTITDDDTGVAFVFPKTKTSAAGAQTLNFDFRLDATSTIAPNEVLLAAFTGTTAAPIALGGATVTPTVTFRSSALAPLGAPVFATNTQGTGTAFGVSDCVTSLLFPFVTNALNFDTGVAIANTTDDDLAFGTGLAATAVAGSCNLFLFPTNRATGLALAPIGPVNSGTISAGETYLATLSGSFSSNAPSGLLTAFAGKEGYAIAVCGFLNAHAFAFVTDPTGAPTLYVANVIPSPTLVSRAVPAGGAGETLGH